MAALDFRTRLGRRAVRSGLTISDSLGEALHAYYELLSRWNRKINLTALTDPDAAIDRLLLEPLAAARHLGPDPIRFLDVGSGSGSPAIPLALALPAGTRVTMVEVKARKSAFLREVVRTLGMHGSTVETSRYEELLARPELHEAHDALTLRAVRIEPRALVSIQAFVRVGGSVLLFRGATGPEAPASIVPPLAFDRTVPLVDTNQSRLTILIKQSVGIGR